MVSSHYRSIQPSLPLTRDSLIGCDFVGEVVSLGSENAKLEVGDQVAGLIWGGKMIPQRRPLPWLTMYTGEIKGLGAYSEYTLVDDAISFKIPSAVSPAEAATVPLAATTAWLALFSKTSLSIPRLSTQQSVLIWGGSCECPLYFYRF